jgi:alpha-amylase/alpha-mannosidase (GH57 family)
MHTFKIQLTPEDYWEDGKDRVYVGSDIMQSIFKCWLV